MQVRLTSARTGPGWVRALSQGLGVPPTTPAFVVLLSRVTATTKTVADGGVLLPCGVGGRTGVSESLIHKTHAGCVLGPGDQPGTLSRRRWEPREPAYG